MPVARLSADTLIENGVIRTQDAAGTVASALAIKDGKIIGVGSEEELRPLADRQTEVIDAGGRAIFPGFIDPHGHVHNGAIARAFHIDWGEDNRPANIPEALDAIRKRAAQTPPGEWIFGDGLVGLKLEERRLPTRWELDSATDKHPVIVSRGPNVPIAVNSFALRLAGIDRTTPDPPTGFVGRTADGEVTGELFMAGRYRLDPRHPQSVLPTYSAEQRLEPIKDQLRDVLAEGVTSIHDMVSDPAETATWIRLRRAGELTVRVQMLMRGIMTKTPLEHLVGLGLEHDLGDDWLRFGGVKMSIDGVCAYRTAAVYDAYPGQPDNFGVLHIPADVLNPGVEACHKAGIRLIIHAVGQKSVDMALDAFENAFKGTLRPELRHRLEHIHLPARPGQLERIARLGLTIGVQPSFIWKHGDAWIDIWGKEQLAGVMPLRRMLDLGIHIFGGTDFPGTPISPLLAFRSALARLTKNGQVLDPSQAITLDEVIRMWTISAAWAAGEEHEKGSLEVGKLADLVILAQDPYTVAPEYLHQVKVDLTMVGGRPAYQRQGQELAVAA